MKPLYKQNAVRSVLGCQLRPGGKHLTYHLLEKLELSTHQRILDIGCGPGSTSKFLIEKGYVNTISIDVDHEMLIEAKQNNLSPVRGVMENLPLAKKSVDTIICECAWNISNKKKSLREFKRVLSSRGTLAISDIYFRAKAQPLKNVPWPATSCFYQATTLESVKQLLNTEGFIIRHIEDCTHYLKQTAAEFIFKHGSLELFWQKISGSLDKAKILCDSSKNIKPGLFTLVAQRENNE
jgi:arsenite methyltransferase